MFLVKWAQSAVV